MQRNDAFSYFDSSSFKQALIDTFAVACGYIPLGIAFGFLFQKIGAPLYLAPLMSLMVFAGAAQFIAISVLSTHGSLWSILLSTLLVNLRHIFYGVSFVGKFPKWLPLKLYMIFSLTDESYSILTANRRPYNNVYAFWVMALSHGYWILGACLGAALGTLINRNLYFLRFSLTALFIILTVEQALKVKSPTPFIIAIVVSLIAYYTLPVAFLLMAIGLASVALTVNYFYRENNHACD